MTETTDKSQSAKEPRDITLPPSRWSIGDHARTIHVVTVEMGTERDDLSKPKFWAHIAVKMRPYDHIEVRCDDGTFYAEMLVLSCDRSWAKVKELNYVSLTSQDISMTEAAKLEAEYEIKFRGPHAKYAVIRKSDSGVVKDGMLKDEADTFLKQYVRTVA